MLKHQTPNLRISRPFIKSEQRLHHLLSSAKCKASSLMDKIAVEFVRQIEQLELQDELQLIIDESGFAKKDKKSKGGAQ